MRRLKYTALHRAVLDCRVAQVRILVEQCGADVNSQDLYGRTPLMLCCALENQRVAMAMAKLLLSADPDLGVKDDLGRTVLAHAGLFGREALVAHLAETRVIDPTEPDNDGCTPLHHAAVQGNSRIVALLVRSCAEGRSNVDCQNRLGCTPLMLACRLRQYHCALFLLLDGGASGFLRDDAHFLSALEWLRAAERQPLPLPLPVRPLQPLRRAETAPLASGLRVSLQHQHQQHQHQQHQHQQHQHQQHQQQPPPLTFLTEYSNLSGGSLARSRTVTSVQSLPRQRPQPFPLPLPLPQPPGSSGSCPPSRPTTVSSSQRSCYTSVTGDTVYVNVDELSAREARDLLVERLRAQAIEFPYPTPPATAASSATVPASAASAAAAVAPKRNRETERPTTRDLQSLRPPPRSSAVMNACQLLGLYHAAMTAPKPAQAMPQHQREGADPTTGEAHGGAGSSAEAAAASTVAAANAAYEMEASQANERHRDRRASSIIGLDAVGKKSVKFKDVAK